VPTNAKGSTIKTNPIRLGSLAVFKNSLYTLTATVLSKGFLFVFVSLGATLLGPERWGVFTFAMTLVTLLRILTDFGFQILTTREIAVNPSRANVYLWNTVAAKSALSVLSVLSTLFILRSMGMKPVSIVVTLIYSLALIPNTLFTSLLAIFNALERMELSGIVQITMSAIHLCLGVAVLRWCPNLAVLALSLPLAMLVSSFVGFLILRRTVHVYFDLNIMMVRTLIQKAAPFALINVLTYAFQKTDILMLSVFGGDVQVGWYGAAYNIVDGIMFLPMAYTTAIFPRLSREAHDGGKDFGDVLIHSLRHLLSFGLFAAVTIGILADQLVLWVYNESYASSSVLLRILATSLVFMFPNSLMGYVLFSKRKQNQFAQVLVANLGANVILNLLAIPKYKALGAGIVMIATLAISFSLHFYLINRYVSRIHFLKLISKPVIISFAYAGTLLVLSRYNGVAAVVIGGLVYAVLYWVSGILRSEEKLFIRSVFFSLMRSLCLLCQAIAKGNSHR
jgi:O-antigen/teichoic acid export membrane protein